MAATLPRQSKDRASRFAGSIFRSPGENIIDRDAVAAAVEGVDGIVHLAAVSRVIWGENDPALCETTNVDALRNLLALCVGRRQPP